MPNKGFMDTPTVHEIDRERNRFTNIQLGFSTYWELSCFPFG